MILRHLCTAAVAASLSACLSVRQADLDAWVGQPVAALEAHPVFVTLPVVKTVDSDGTEIWNFVDGANIGRCFSASSDSSTQLAYGAYTQFSSCMQQFAACNNVFRIRDGKVLSYAPVGSGGIRCHTTERLRPQQDHG